MRTLRSMYHTCITFSIQKYLYLQIYKCTKVLIGIASSIDCNLLFLLNFNVYKLRCDLGQDQKRSESF